MFLLCDQLLVVDTVQDDDRVRIARGPEKVERRNGAARKERYPKKDDKRHVYGGSGEGDFQ